MLERSVVLPLHAILLSHKRQVWQKYTSSFCLLTAPLAFPPCDLPPFPSYASGQFARMLSPAEVFGLCMSAFGYFWIAVAIVLILALVTYVCFTAFRQLVHKLYRKVWEVIHRATSIPLTLAHSSNCSVGLKQHSGFSTFRQRSVSLFTPTLFQRIVSTT